MRRARSRYLRAGVVSSGMHIATASSCDEMPTKPCASVSWISRASRARSSSTSAKRDSGSAAAAAGRRPTPTRQQQRDHQHAEPRRLVKMRQHLEGVRLLARRTAGQFRADGEAVVPVRQAVVVDDAAAARVHPVAVQPSSLYE